MGGLQGRHGETLASHAIPGGMGGLAGGALLSMILGSGAAGRRGGSLLKAGGLAVLASVAFKAYEDWKAQQMPITRQKASSRPSRRRGSGFHLDEEKDTNGNEMGLALVAGDDLRRQVATAISTARRAPASRSRSSSSGLGNEEKGFLLDLMAKPADAAAIARLPRTKEQAAELYVASRVAIGESTRRRKRPISTGSPPCSTCRAISWPISTPRSTPHAGRSRPDACRNRTGRPGSGRPRRLRDPVGARPSTEVAGLL